ncbi:MAG: glycosyl transferase [Anaerolineaceae bacterium]|nr:glycosyl transferase [Anaerolineaceae bacterium]
MAVLTPSEVDYQSLAQRQFTLSVIIPCYNEVHTVREVLYRVLDVELAHEIVIVDDGSTDGTRDVLREVEAEALPGVRVLYHDRNRGKGAAVLTGLAATSSDVILIQDADFEYDPRDYGRLLRPIEERISPVVYGSRFLNAPRKAMNFWNMIANKSLLLVANVLYNSILSDLGTCYKVFRRDLIADMVIEAQGFEFEAEFTARILKTGTRIYEVPISYNGREWSEGKKIRWVDGLRQFWTLLKYRFVD